MWSLKVNVDGAWDAYGQRKKGPAGVMVQINRGEILAAEAAHWLVLVWLKSRRLWVSVWQQSWECAVLGRAICCEEMRSTSSTCFGVIVS